MLIFDDVVFDAKIECLVRAVPHAFILFVVNVYLLIIITQESRERIVCFWLILKNFTLLKIVHYEEDFYPAKQAKFHCFFEETLLTFAKCDLSSSFIEYKIYCYFLSAH